MLDTGEDFNGNGTLETYGQTPRAAGRRAPLGRHGARRWPSPTDVCDPVGAVDSRRRSAIARRNPAIFFRRALKLTNGALGNLVAPGLTIASENPVYVAGQLERERRRVRQPARRDRGHRATP